MRANDSGSGIQRGAPAWFSPARRIGLLTAVVALAGAALFWGAVLRLPALGTPVAASPGSSGWRAFAAAEVLVVHVQVKRDSHSFSLTDLVLAAGLCLLTPSSLVLAQLLGCRPRARGAPAPVRHEAGLQPRPVPSSARASRRSSSPPSPSPFGGAGAWVWVAALLAIAASTVASNTCIFAVISLSEGSLKLAALPAHAGPLAAVRARHRRGRAARRQHRRPEPGRPRAARAALGPADQRPTARYTKAREQQNNLRLLHEITSLLYNSDDAPTALTDFLGAVRGALRASRPSSCCSAKPTARRR